MDTSENIIYDCNRGCTVSRDGKDNLLCHYRPGCCKLQDWDVLKGVSLAKDSDLFEVRFKNTRKGIYRNESPPRRSSAGSTARQSLSTSRSGRSRSQGNTMS